MPDTPLAQAILEAHILVVDDNPANVQIAIELLHLNGYEKVEGETDPRRVEERCRANPPDLLLLDIRMPHLDGFQLMEILKPIYGADYLPVLVLTAQTDEMTRRKALESGAKDFLNKPILPWELANRVRNLLEVRLLYSRLREHRDHLDDMVKARTRDLEDTRLDVLRRLALAGEFRDNETGLHVVRMSRYTEILARAFGWDDEACAMMRAAAPLHDIGKISIPDAILLKPGKLDPDEFTLMKRHAEIGARILADGNFPLLALAHDIALTHHERWDGQGYPHGKTATDIPLAGRIVALADVFDALTSPRPYKPAWETDRAFAFIESQAGLHFDPDLAGRFLAEREKILAIHSAFHDRE